MGENSHKILVALDGSQKAFRTIDYLCSFKPFLKKELVLHNVITKVPECYYDLKKEPFSYKATARMHAWELEYKALMEVFMEKSRTRLIAAGFNPEAITIIIAKRDKGIARDIMDEARKGYDALLIRRRGGGQSFLPLVMGSVSTKVVEKATFLPVMLAGVQQVNHSLLLTIDGSEGSKRAVEFVAKIIEDSPCRVVLCSVLRDFDVYDERKKKKSPPGFIKAAFEEIEIAAREAEKRLEMAGIQRKNISIKIIQGAKSRSGAIVEAAKEEKCDTIVFGRKGKSNVSRFDIGRVPWKVVHGAREMTVWMVP
jgi:nucleotide-binding universal stress UspA family protein